MFLLSDPGVLGLLTLSRSLSGPHSPERRALSFTFTFERAIRNATSSVWEFAHQAFSQPLEQSAAEQRLLRGHGSELQAALRALGDVEQRVYDDRLAERMRSFRLARSRRDSDWAEQWLALEDEYERCREQARALLGDWVADVDLHDGHVAEVELSARAFVERGSELLARAPWVRHLHLSDYAEIGPSLFECPHLRGMQSLGLPEQGLTDQDVDALVASPHVDGLRWLELSGNRLGRRAFEALATCTSLVRLEYVGLDDNESESPIDDVGTDPIDGTVISTTRTAVGRALERLAGRTLAWLHAPERFPNPYPPSPLDVAFSAARSLGRTSVEVRKS